MNEPRRYQCTRQISKLDTLQALVAQQMESKEGWGCQGRPPPESNFFNFFISFREKIGQKNRLTPPLWGLAFLSDYLTDLYTGKSKKKFVKNCPQWGWKPGPPDLQAYVLPTELGRNLTVGQEISEVSFVCFMHHFICWTLFISRINRA